MAHREQMFGKADFIPSVSFYVQFIDEQGEISHFFDGTYYLIKVDDKYRRFYAIKGENSEMKPLQEVQSSKLS